MLQAVADTHALIWHLADDPRLSPRVAQMISTAAENGDRIGVSVMSIVEVIFLEEKGRIPPGAFQRLDQLLEEQESVLLELPIDHRVAMAVNRIDRQQIRELPDRIIAATALVYGVPLLSRDRMIRSSEIETIW